MEIQFVYKKIRSEFGRQCKFVDTKPDLMVNIQPNELLTKDFVTRQIVETATQNATSMTEHHVNTIYTERDSRGFNHTEGGWPKEIDPQSVEHVTRFRKKAERVESYMNAVVALGTTVSHFIKQNNAINIYEEYFSDIPKEERSPSPSAKAIVTIRDPNDVKRSVSHISWSPYGGKKLAVAHCTLDFQRESADTSIFSYIWNVEEYNTPELKIKPVSPLLCLEHNPKEPTILAGGCYNGQISLWDTRKGSSSTSTTPIVRSHRDPVYKVLWLQCKSGTECFSASTDGHIMWWDTRYLVEPFETLRIPSFKTPGAADGVVSIDYDTNMPTRYLLGTEDGVVMAGNKKAKAQMDRLVNQYMGHLGPVYAVQRHPFFPKFFLSVGDWTARIWSEDLKDALISTPIYNSYLTDGCWSPVRPAVFITTRADGMLDVWDLIVKHKAPVLTLHVSDSSIYALRAQENGKLVSTGSASGTTTILELSTDLATVQTDEKHTVATLFERECKQERAVGARDKLVRRATYRPSIKDVEELTSEKLCEKVEVEFFNAVKENALKQEQRNSILASRGDQVNSDDEAVTAL